MKSRAEHAEMVKAAVWYYSVAGIEAAFQLASTGFNYRLDHADGYVCNMAVQEYGHEGSQYIYIWLAINSHVNC